MPQATQCGCIQTTVEQSLPQSAAGVLIDGSDVMPDCRRAVGKISTRVTQGAIGLSEDLFATHCCSAQAAVCVAIRAGAVCVQCRGVGRQCIEIGAAPGFRIQRIERRR